MSLIEIIVVITIISMLMSAVGVYALGIWRESQVRTAVTREKKRAAAEAIARDAGARMARGGTMDQVAQQLRLPIETIGPFTRTATVRLLGIATAAVGSAFRLRVGERSGQLANDEGFFYLEAQRLVRADSADWTRQKEQQRIEVLRAARQLRVRFFLEGLRSAAKVENGLAALRRRPAVADSTK